WVLDPQKYADAAIHDRFLKPLSSHADVMLVVINHIDEVPPGELDSMVSDVRRLLVADGLPDVPVIATSATRGDGMDIVHQELTRRVAEKRLARDRLVADIKSAAEELHALTGSAQPPALADTVRDELVGACVDAAGVPVLVDGVES